MQDHERFRPHLAQRYYLLATTYQALGEYERAFEANKTLVLDYSGLGSGKETDLLAAGGVESNRPHLSGGRVARRGGDPFFREIVR